jgi:hypothetical protein
MTNLRNIGDPVAAGPHSNIFIVVGQFLCVRTGACPGLGNISKHRQTPAPAELCASLHVVTGSPLNPGQTQLARRSRCPKSGRAKSRFKGLQIFSRARCFSGDKVEALHGDVVATLPNDCRPMPGSKGAHCFTLALDGSTSKVTVRVRAAAAISFARCARGPIRSIG